MVNPFNHKLEPDLLKYLSSENPSSILLPRACAPTTDLPLTRLRCASWSHLLEIAGKPILKIEDGEVHPAGRVRSTAKARQQLRDNVINAAPVERLALAYSTTRDVANEMATELQQHVVSGEVILYQIGPVVGTHEDLQ